VNLLDAGNQGHPVQLCSTS